MAVSQIGKSILKSKKNAKVDLDRSNKIKESLTELENSLSKN
jgi:hypothetical protein